MILNNNSNNHDDDDEENIQQSGGDNNHESSTSFNPINTIRNINFNPLGLDLNPLNVDFQGHRDRVVNFFQHGTDDLNTRMQSVVGKLRSNEYRKKMTTVLHKIKDTKEYRSTNNTDYDVIFESVDMYSNLQADPTLDKDEIDVVTDLSSTKKRLHHWLKKERISTLMFIPILGIAIACMGLLCDYVLKELGELRTIIMPEEHSMYSWLNGVVFVGYSVVLAAISACCISFISPYAVGSGIPEMKSILSGINLSRVLGGKTLVSKIIGMVSATAAGLTIGRTGPFMHASAIIAQQMMSLKIFQNIRKNQIVRYQMFICALASGVVANFGAPIGGLLFSIEITATNCIFGNLWKGFLCATTTAIIFYLSRPWMGGAAFASVYQFDYTIKSFGWLEIANFVGIGIICGIIGAVFVFLYEKIVRFRLRYQAIKQSRVGLVVFIALVSATITYLAGPLVRKPLSYAMKEFIHDDEIEPFLFNVDKDNKNDPHRLYNIMVFIAVKLFLTAINIVLPIPGGAITPFIVTGAAMGRLFGELLHYHLNLTSIKACGYAVIGAAGLVSGTTRALSPSIFVLELTGQLSLLIPVLVCSITATAVGNFFNRPLFDIALKIQGLPFLSSYRSEKVYTMTAKQVMKKDINYLSMSSTVNEIKDFLEKFKHTFIPIVDSKQNMLLVGIVERSSMYILIDEHIERMDKMFEDYKNSIQNNNSVNNSSSNSNNQAIVEQLQQQQQQYNTADSIITDPKHDQQDEQDDDEDDDNARLIPSNNNSSNNSDFEMVNSPSSKGSSNSELVREIENENNSNNSSDKPHLEEINLEDEEDNSNHNADITVEDDDDDQEGVPLVNLNKDGGLRNRKSKNDSTTTNNNTTTTTTTSNDNNNNSNNFIISFEEIKNLKSEHIWGQHILGDIIQNGETAILMDLAPSQIPDLTPLNKVFHLFTMLGLGFTYVTSLGKLVGVITKTDLISKEL
ncbi:hypothetical protein CYY_001088 [Polysphondylium violaceum]|uniref:Chloride channel protein n=1 Tax=Polysphondylium violaceum TaxID=133409 RepID=A0A8J4V1X2_9MYCE|nr:hypothetical protein CYY_001088 [Polysphondylium violaceum]